MRVRLLFLVSGPQTVCQTCSELNQQTVKRVQQAVQHHDMGMFLLLWCWSVYHIAGIMDQSEDIRILEEVLLPSAGEETTWK